MGPLEHTISLSGYFGSSIKITIVPSIAGSLAKVPIIFQKLKEIVLYLEVDKNHCVGLYKNRLFS